MRVKLDGCSSADRGNGHGNGDRPQHAGPPKHDGRYVTTSARRQPRFARAVFDDVALPAVRIARIAERRTVFTASGVSNTSATS